MYSLPSSSLIPLFPFCLPESPRGRSSSTVSTSRPSDLSTFEARSASFLRFVDLPIPSSPLSTDPAYSFDLQDPQLFSGTIRTNLDPFSEKTDHELWSALKRAYLVPELSSLPEREKGDDMHAGGRFGLDTVVDDDGCNLSVGGESK